MIQQSHFWVYFWKKSNQCHKKISAPSCSLSHELHQPRYGNHLSVYHWDEWIKKMKNICIYMWEGIQEYYSALKHKEILSFVTKQMKFEGIYCLVTKSDREIQILHDLIYTWNPKRKTNSQKQTIQCWFQGGEMGKSSQR